ncbi:MAG: hypothetical protein IT445_00040 [Phycisphaeraceae bacterium]|nr:hypothetical protein [Phycisphaeraceae bacterium]
MSDQQQFDKLNESVQRLTVKTETYQTFVAQHVEEQRAMNRHLKDRLDDHEGRIRSVERWQYGKDATLPKRIISAETIEESIRTLSQGQENLRLVIAKWGGGIAAALVIVQIILKIFW